MQKCNMLLFMWPQYLEEHGKYEKIWKKLRKIFPYFPYSMTRVHGFECYIEEEFGLILHTLVICEVNFCPQNIENSINSRNEIFK